MGFRFNLEVVLRLRKSFEERELWNLEKIQLELANLRHSIQKVEVQQQEAARARQVALSGGLCGADLHAFITAENALDLNRKSLLEQVALVSKKQAEQLAIYQEAKLKREVLSEMRAQQKEVHDQKLATADQKRLDEIFATRRNRN